MNVKLYKIQPSDFSPKQKSLELFSETEIAILQLLNEPQTKNYIYEKSGLAISKYDITLSILELKDVAKEEYGRIYKVK